MSETTRHYAEVTLGDGTTERRRIVTEGEALGYWLRPTTTCPECAGAGCRDCGGTGKRRWALFVRLDEVRGWRWCRPEAHHGA